MLSRDEFAGHFSRGLQRTGEMRPIHYDAEIFCLVIGTNRDAPDVVIGLGEAYRFFESVPAERMPSVFDDLARRYYKPPIPDDYSKAESNLSLCLKHVTFLHLHEEFCAAWSNSSPRRPLAHLRLTDELVCCVTFTAGGTMQYVTANRLATWGVGVECAVSAAGANLNKSGLHLERRGAVFVTPDGDVDAATRLLILPRVLGRMTLDGFPVVLVPSRERLVVTGSKDLDGLEQMAAIGQMSLDESGYPVSAQPLMLYRGKWEIFEPPAGVRSAFAQVSQAFGVDRYRCQSGVLAFKYRAAADRPAIAEIRQFATRDGSESYTIWRSDKPTLLPRADKVALDDPAQGVFEIVRWTDLARVLGDRMIVLNHSPPRYRVEQFPTRSEIQAMNPVCSGPAELHRDLTTLRRQKAMRQ